MILQPFSEYAKTYYIVYTRWQMFLDYLEIHGDEYEQVLVMDTRDAIFQDDVFKSFADCSNYLGYTLEYDDIRGSNFGQDINYRWLTEYFSKAEAEKLADETIICCGTVIGTVAEMKIFIRKMIEYMPAKLHGVDQVTQQYITYHNLLPIENLIPIDCVTGAILTSYLFHAQEPIEVSDNMILRGDGGVPAVVHQYDRSPSLIKLVDEVYRDKNFQPDVRFVDAKSAVEQIYLLITLNRFNDAPKFWMNNLINTNFFGCADNLLDILFMTLPRPLTIEVELLEILIQRTLMATLSNGINLPQINRLYNYVDISFKTNRTVNVEFKKFVGTCLFEMAKVFLKNDVVQQADNYINAAISLNIPQTTEFYFLQTEIYRKLGRNEESLAAYKKALKLN